MRLIRLVPVLVVGALIAASAAPAAAATPGTGSTVGRLSVIDVTLGDVLAVSLLTDQGSADTDPETGGPIAAAQLSALQVSSELLGVDQQIPLLSVESTGDEQTAEQAVTPMDPITDVVDGSVLPVSLSALVGEDGAVSNIGAGLADLSVLAGVLGVSSTDLALASNAGTADSDGDRSLNLDGLTVLDLGTLLAGLGIPISSLPLDTVLALVDSLGLLPELGTLLDALGLPVDLDNLSVEAIEMLVTGLLDLAVELGGGTCDVTDPLLIGLGLGDLNVLCATAADVLAEVNTAIQDLLGAVFDILDDVALLSVGGLDVGVVTAATDSLDTSAADVTAAIDTLQIGSLELPGVDLLGTAEEVTAVVDQAEAALDGILTIIDPALVGLIDLGILEQQTAVTENEGTIDAGAVFRGLRADVLPDLQVLDGIVQQLEQVTSIGDELVDAGGTLPVEPIEVLNGQLSEALGEAAVALGDGLGIRVASIEQASTFTEVLPSTATPELPSTGSNDTWVLLMGAVAAAGALGVRRVVRTN